MMDKRELQKLAGVYEDMDDQEFNKLKTEIKVAMDRVEQLQKIYVQQTGRKYRRGA